nr:alpha/beta hydrolase [candidate division Zixibacteria bacterium]
MAKLMSKKTRETVLTATVLVIVVAFIFFYIIYPLITVPGLTCRSDRDTFDDPDYAPVNDAAYFVELGLNPDTFTVTTDDNLRLACLYFAPDSAIYDSVRGTVVFLNSSDTDRTAFAPYLSPLLDSGLAVVLYDLRATGLSGGTYHTAGFYESDDLNQLLIYLKFHERDRHPLITVGFGIGGDAVLSAARKEQREELVVAIDPFITAARWINMMKQEKGAWPIPFYNRLYYWWYLKLYGLPLNRTGLDDIQAVASRTVVAAAEENLESPEIKQLIDLSSEMVTPVKKPTNETAMKAWLVELIYREL